MNYLISVGTAIIVYVFVGIFLNSVGKEEPGKQRAVYIAASLLSLASFLIMIGL